MKLAVFTNQFPGPVCTFFARDMRGLIDAGIELDVFPIYPLDPALWRHVPDILNDTILAKHRVHAMGLGKSLLYFRALPLQKLPIIFRETTTIASDGIRRGFWPFVKSLYVLPKSWAWAQSENSTYDHVLAYWGNYAATAAYVFHRLTDQNVPFSVFFHAGIDLYREPTYFRQKLLYADNIITCSEFNRNFIHTTFPELWPSISSKIHVHSHGVDLQEFSFTDNGRLSRRIVAVGRIERRKGFDYLLRATQELKSRGIPIVVDIIGDGQEIASLTRLANELDIAETVNFRGWLSNTAVRDAMKQAAILVHPSSGLGDGVPNVIKEAMAVGTPVIGSAVAGIPELLDHGRCGLLVPPQDVTALASAIQLLLQDDARRRQYAHAARQYAEEGFDLWRNGKRLAALLNSTRRLKG